MEKLLTELFYIRRVIASCKTESQLNNAKKWAYEWANRAQAKNSNLVPYVTELYSAAIS